MVAYASDLAAVYAAEGETMTVGGSPVVCFFDEGYADALGIVGERYALRCIASTVASAAVGDTVVRGSTTYTIRGIQPIWPDALEAILVLEAA